MSTTRIIVCNNGMECLVDESDFEYVSQFKWAAETSSKKNWYAVRRVYVNRKCSERILMHRELMALTDKALEVDHINGNGLDNRRSNMRGCTHAENLRNRRSINTGRKCSKYRGVAKHRNGWTASLSFQGETNYLGKFNNEADAARAYDKAAVQIFGAFANPNFPEEAHE